jgi:hypothetical protein
MSEDEKIAETLAARKRRAETREANAKANVVKPKKAAPKKAVTNKAVVVVDTKAEKAVAKQKVIDAANKKMDPLAREVNTRFEKIAKLEGDANDHRLSAALRLAEAEKIASEAGIKFKEWAAENIKEQGWEAVRKLLYVGRSEDPKAALSDMRGQARKAAKKHRDGKKADKPAIKAPAKPIDVVMALKPEDQTDVIKKVAKDLGLAVVTKDDEKVISQVRKEGTKPAEAAPAKSKDASPFGYDAIVRGIGDLKQSEKHKLVRWLAEVLGLVVFVSEPSKEDADAALEIPDFLKK